MNKDIRRLAIALRDELGGHKISGEICSQSSYDVFSCILGKIAEYEFADDKPETLGEAYSRLLDNFNAKMQEHIEQYHPTECQCERCKKRREKRH